VWVGVGIKQKKFFKNKWKLLHSFASVVIDLSLSFSGRFDLIYLMLDKADEQTDRRLAKHIVSLHYKDYEVCL